ncbi:MAG: DUF3592 domain-containing protein [Acidobacteria bacterium]|nr:DUF3592 domain-containing protein [Acidobacteriota bacterium]
MFELNRLIAFGILILAHTVVALYLEWETSKWPFVEGVVDDLAIREELDEGTKIYEPIVRYRYIVEGQEYRSERIRRYREGGTSLRSQKQRLQRFLPQTCIRVYYNPQKPHISVLEAGLQLEDLMIGGMVLSFAGALLLIGLIW